MASSREGETALWLHNKLGSTDDLWSGRSIYSQLSKEKLQHIIGCFRSLQPHVKVKLLLSFLHIPKRNISEWKSSLEDIIDLAVDDRDQWVSTVGEILKTYPSTFLVNTTDLSGSSTFYSMYSELKKLVRKSTDATTLPLECMCLGKTALASSVNQIPTSHKHFMLKRKPKSSALRADLLIKSQEIQNSTKKGLPTGNIPMKVRSNAKRMDVEIAVTQSQSLSSSSTRNGSSSAAGFLKANTLSTYSSSHRQASSLAMRKIGGAKMLDISEMPPTGKEAKRRKKMEEQEAAAQAKKEKEEAAAAERAAAAAKATPDYAADLGVNSAIKASLPSAPRANPTATTPSYLPNASPHLTTPVQSAPLYHRYMYKHYPVPFYEPAPIHYHRCHHPAGYGRDMASHTITTHPPPMKITRPAINVVSHPSQKIRLPPNPQQSIPGSSIRPLVHPTQSMQNRPHIQPNMPISHANPAEPMPPQNMAAQQPKKTLSLTKELMQEAQEMFRNSNKVSRPEKALILGFMAGSRDNPCPAQGHIVNIRLSENMEPVRLQDGSIREIMIETYFQMNYQTGEWKRIKKPKEPLSIVSV